MPKITKDMTIGEVIEKHPKVVGIMLRYGLHCVGCGIAAMETIEQGAKGHGMSDKEIEMMVRELNDAAKG